MLTDEKIKLNSCSLCSNEVSYHPIFEGDLVFCCPGCHAVYQILSSQNQLDNFFEHPVFLQAVKSGLISNPNLLESLRKEKMDVPDQEWQKIYLEIHEMWCPSCAEIIKWILLQERGVKNCVVDYTTDLAAIEYTPRFISKKKIFSLIQSFGYAPCDLDDKNQKQLSFFLKLRLIIASFCSLNIMMFAYPLYTHYFDGSDHDYSVFFARISLLLSLPVVTYSAFPIYRRFLNSLRLGLFGMETLVVIGILASFLLSFHSLWNGGTQVYFDTMTVIITFVLLGKIIESRAKFRTKEALKRLTLAIPRRGRRRNLDGGEEFVLAKEIDVGDEVVVIGGEKIVLDGFVIEGGGICDESLMTGEAVPVVKKIDDSVIGGTILLNGRLVLKVTHKMQQTALQKIVELVQEDIGHKTTYVRAADQVVRWFVPCVVLIAILVAFFSSVYSAIATLLISCPCAIGIAAPLAESGIIDKMASLGAIVRNRACLMFLGKETVFVFDKTGTVTEGMFSIQSGLDALSLNDLKVLKEMTKHSNHLIATAIHNAIEIDGIKLDFVEEFTGKGIRASLNGSLYHLGSFLFLKSEGVLCENREHGQHMCTFVGFSKNKICQTVISLGDQIKKDAKVLIENLEVETVLLTGDGEEVASWVAKDCHFDKWVSRCTPLMKREFIEKRKACGDCVAMLGDGINDAAALTCAHIGISVVTATDISIQVSDLLLTTDRLTVLSQLEKIAKKGRKVISQNLFWAFFYNCIGIPFAAFGYLTPLYSAIAMVISSLIVILNAKRINSSSESLFHTDRQS